MPHPETPAVELITDPARAAALLHPERLRMLEALGRGDSAAGLSRKLGLPRQRINYHLRELEKRGLVELAEERRRGNCTERVVRASARSYVISPDLVGPLGRDADPARDRFSPSHLLAVAARTVRELGTVGGRAGRAEESRATLTLDTELRFASAERRDAFAEEVAAVLSRIVAKYHDEYASAGRTYRVLLASHPKPVDASGGQPDPGDDEG